MFLYELKVGEKAYIEKMNRHEQVFFQLKKNDPILCIRPSIYVSKNQIIYIKDPANIIVKK